MEARSDQTPFDKTLHEWAALRERLSRLIRLQLDWARVSLGSGLVWLLGFAWCCVLVLTVSILALFNVMRGLTHGLTLAFGGRVWAGELVSGLLILGDIAEWAFLSRARPERASLDRVVAKYGDVPQ
jgi:hypothetical protein